MREALSNSKWAKVGTGLIFGAIIVTFVLFFGPQSEGMNRRTTTWVAKVSGRTITNIELAATFDRFQQITGSRGRVDDAEYALMQRHIVLAMAGLDLLAARAESEGLSVSEDELRCFLVDWHRGYTVGGKRICADFPANYSTVFRNYDAFWFTEADGRFTQYYEETIRNRFQMSARDYEATKRRELLARYYLAALQSAVVVPPEVVRNTWERRNTRVSLEYVALDPSRGVNTEPGEEELAAFIEANGGDIQSTWSSNSERFSEERKVHLRRIYVRRPDANDAEFAAAEARYQSLLEQAQAPGADFAALATANSEIATEAEAGGDMGERTQSTISSDLWEATQSMTVGEARGVEQQYAWNVLYLEAATDARLRPLAEVREEIARELFVQRQRDAASAGLQARGERILALAASSDSLADAAAAEAAERDAEGLPGSALLAETTSAFAIERPNPLAGMEGLPAGLELPPEPPEAIPGIGSSAELAHIAFSLTPEAPLHPALVEVEGVSYVVQLASRTNAGDTVPPTEAAAIEAELRNALVATVVGTDDQIASLVLNAPNPLPPFVENLIESSLASGRIVLREKYFQGELDENEF